MKFFDRVKMRTATTGTGNLTLGTAPLGFRTLAQAGASDGDEVPYVISEGASFARGIASSTESTTPVVRDANEIRWTGGVESTAKLSLAGTALVFVGLYGEILEGLVNDATAAAASAAAALASEGVATTKAAEAATSASDAASSAAALDSIEQNFTPSDTSNLNDPSFQPPGMAARSDQVNRTYNVTTGALNSQSTSTWPTWVAWMGPPLTGGQTYTMNLSGAPSGAYFDISARLPFYTSSGVFSSSETTGFSFSADKRSVTFTVPGTGLKRPALSIRDVTTGWTASNPMTLAYANLILDNVMIVAGSSTLPFMPYSAAGTLEPSASAFSALLEEGACVMAVQPPYTFIRAPLQLSATEDVVWRVLTNETPTYGGTGANKTGTIDFVGARIIARSTSAAQTIAAYNLSTQIWSAGMDERTPVKLNGHYLGGGHTCGGFVATKTAHGLTTANEGAICSDGSRQYTIGKIISADAIFIMSQPGGASDKWSMSTVVPTNGSTLTWVSGGANFGAVGTWTFAAGSSPPFLQNLSISGYLNDEAIDLTAAGVHIGDNPKLIEHWDIPNCASLVAYQNAHVGAVDFTNGSIDIQVKIDNAFVWNEWGAMTAYRTENVVQAYDRSAHTVSATGDYNGAIQMQRLSKTGDSTPGAITSIWAYVPNVAPVSGYDLEGVADITSLAAFLPVPTASCDDTADPASHFALIGKDGSGNVIGGMVYGYARTVGVGVPATRAASVNVVTQITSALKSYPVGTDVALGDAVAGDVYNYVAFRSYFKPTDSALTIPAVIYTVGNKHYAIVTSHQVQSKKWVALAKRLLGWNVRAIKIDAGITLEGEVGGVVPVQGAGVMMSFANTYGDAVLEVYQ